MRREKACNKFIKNKKLTKKINILLLVFALLIFNVVFQDVALANITSTNLNMKEPIFTSEEKDYIAKVDIIKAGTIGGAAPLSFKNKDGEIEGIFQQVLDRVSQISGLTFETRIYDSVETLLDSDSDIAYGISKSYALDNIILSKPFLKTETILYINSSINADKLEDKIYAAVGGGALPEGIEEKNSIYYATREDSLYAVDSGNADYGYGNAYSVSYYSLKNGFKNIVTVPIGKETREYCIGILNSDEEILLSIINKSLDLIDENQIQTFVLETASSIEREVTIDMIVDTYGKEISIIIAIAFIMLILIVLYIRNVSKKIKEQNRRYEVLSKISNEYLYEYHAKGNELNLSNKFNELFNTQESRYEVNNILKGILLDESIDWTNYTIKLALPEGHTGIFKATNSKILDHRGRIETIIGKLIDVSEEIHEKEKLLIESQTDGLTGLYNALTTKNLITERIQKKEDNSIDAFILIDCDDFKNINDTYGHLVGNHVLESIANIMKQIFRKNDIYGRIGGDEFCIYVKDIPSIEFVHERIHKLSLQIKKNSTIENASVSIGIVLVYDKGSYEDIFKKADDALYEAKNKGKGQLVIFNELK
ncbi:MAG: GGDEF domain-containing protein [Eubacteriales bacterium]|nr:GGDEF domain-containing protein [Eubacteriales bacterium]MDD4565927.1 GGDEF domain-containing protein [Eubacteriales bacterium]